MKKKIHLFSFIKMEEKKIKTFSSLGPSPIEPFKYYLNLVYLNINNY